LKFIKDGQEAKNEQVSTVKCLQEKDVTNISDNSWNRLRKNLNLQSSLPSIYRVKKKRQELNKLTTIFENENGSFVSVKDKINFLCNKNKERLSLETSEAIYIKFTGDGVQTSRNMNVFNMNFCILNDQQDCKSAEGHYSIGTFRIKSENHENVERSLKEVLKEVEGFDFVEIDGKSFRIIKYLTGDLKFLALFMGIMSANSKYPCVWCKRSKCDFKDIHKEFSIIDKQKMARTLEEAEVLSMNQEFGYKTIPMSKCFPFHFVIIDILHLFLRITDTLINLLKQDFELVDGFVKDINESRLLKRYCDFLESKCNVSKPFFISKKNNIIELTDLVGPQKELLFSQINISELFPELNNATLIDRVWKDFYSIYCLFKINSNCQKTKAQVMRCKFIEENCANMTLTPGLIKEKTKQWMEKFIALYEHTDFTPYLHAFCSHLHEFVEIHGDINYFNQEGMEKHNHNSTKIYHNSTNKKDNKCSQIQKKKNRLEMAYF
jgi:hypothetical protein